MLTVGRRGLLAGLAAVLVVALALATAGGLATSDDRSSGAGSDGRSATEGSPSEDSSKDSAEDSAEDSADGYRFLSSPDFMNADVADLSDLPGFGPDTPNSWNDSYAVAVDTVMDAFAAEDPDDVLVAGDLVNGHWGLDTQRTGVFGPVGTERQKRAAVARAAETYYGAWRRLFEDRDLPVHVAVGDHEMGDNDWSGSEGNDFKRRSSRLLKDQLATHVLRPGRYESRPPGPARRTAYATRLHPEVLLVTVDVFERTPTDVVPRLDPQQLRWFDGVLRDAAADEVDWILVQGHTPVLGPVRTTSSSGLMYAGGGDSPFWRSMARHGVDLYLSGEVHDITARRYRGVTQISHGGIFTHANREGRGGTNYLLGEVEGDELRLESHRFRVETSQGSPRLWQTTRKGRPPVRKRFAPTPELVGTMRLASDGTLLERDGLLAPYEPGDAP